MIETFVRTLCECAARDPAIFLLNCDAGPPILRRFAEEFPDRYLNVGIAEANAISVAAGMASTGMKPVVYGLAAFLGSKGYEQIRVDIGLHGIAVKLVAIGAGNTFATMGPTHQAFDDVGLMRLLGRIGILLPCDADDVASATAAMFDAGGGELPPLARVSRSQFTQSSPGGRLCVGNLRRRAAHNCFGGPPAPRRDRGCGAVAS